jgi:heme-degrading monooxygenase HmoA
MFVQVIEGRLKSEDGWKTIEDMERAWARDEEQRAPGYISGDWLKDRKDPRHVLAVIRFESAEKAQENSGRPETNRFYERMLSLLEEAPSFLDCDRVEA